MAATAPCPLQRYKLRQTAAASTASDVLGAASAAAFADAARCCTSEAPAEAEWVRLLAHAAALPASGTVDDPQTCLFRLAAEHGCQSDHVLAAAAATLVETGLADARRRAAADHANRLLDMLEYADRDLEASDLAAPLVLLAAFAAMPACLCACDDGDQDHEDELSHFVDGSCGGRHLAAACTALFVRCCAAGGTGAALWGTADAAVGWRALAAGAGIVPRLVCDDELLVGALRGLLAIHLGGAAPGRAPLWPSPAPLFAEFAAAVDTDVALEWLVASDERACFLEYVTTYLRHGCCVHADLPWLTDLGRRVKAASGSFPYSPKALVARIEMACRDLLPETDDEG